jgi:hypothetical protein
VLCEIASRVGGAGIRHVVNQLFDISLDRVWAQAQCEDFVDEEANELLENRKPKHNSCGWTIMYPIKGKLTSMPLDCPLDFVVKYFPIGTIGRTYENATHSADAVAQFIVIGTTEEECEKNIFKSMDWFNNNTKWE